MKTIKEITALLTEVKEPESWMEELAQDSRAGVQNALRRWKRQYDKQKAVEQNHMVKEAFDMSFAPFEGALIAGVDEAGRGPLAGPVVTAAVILPRETPELIGLDDSKAISKVERERLAEQIKSVAIAYSAHIQSARIIDEMNIYAATRDSMEQAVKGLAVNPDFVIADAMKLDTNCPTESVIKGDAKSLAVAAASIIAKTTRDAIMDNLHNGFPMYNFKKNAGYGTAEHVLALQTHGPCEHHRTSFEPVKSMIKDWR
ncbi:ribonuclease HII [Sporosarcina sp. ANT_H38]|uniref:ribonuclease HII n=1 Tax=Sporosarcina sp. ANT_H38 TaxID=2597358 RepID=UPI0011F308A2|nr:ribonuclease HII [Sporosarcina sp. ANT_H38]KAA0966531.1 ribonuclease HII [Sporosarcina sp. ANT_H38]